MVTRTFVLPLPEESSEQLEELASHRGISVDTFVQEAIEHVLAWEREALEAHEEGIRQIERGEFYTNEEVRALLDSAIQKRTAA